MIKRLFLSQIPSIIMLIIALPLGKWWGDVNSMFYIHVLLFIVGGMFLYKKRKLGSIIGLIPSLQIIYVGASSIAPILFVLQGSFFAIYYIAYFLFLKR